MRRMQTRLKKKLFSLVSCLFLIPLIMGCGGGPKQSRGGTNAFSADLAIDWTAYQNYCETDQLDLTGHIDINYYKFIGYAGETYTIRLSGFADDLDLYLQYECEDAMCGVGGSSKTGLDPETYVFNCTETRVYYILASGQNDSSENSVRYTLCLSSDNGGHTNGQFNKTDTTYTIDDDLNAICRQEFGDDYGLADWLDIVDEYEAGISADNILLEGAAYVSYDGYRFFLGDRHYHTSRHDHNLPGGYLSHDDIDNHLFDLGSWHTNMSVLCYAPTGGSGDDNSDTEVDLTGTSWSTTGRYVNCGASGTAHGNIEFLSSGSLITGYTYTGENWHHECIVDDIGTVQGNLSSLNLTNPLSETELESLCDGMWPDPGYEITLNVQSSNSFSCTYFDLFDSSTEIVTYTK